MQKFRKKPVVIEAVELTKDNVKDCLKLIHGLKDVIIGDVKIAMDDAIGIALQRNCRYIQTLEGSMKANFGDWIIKGISGEFYPCKPDIFEKTYESV